LEVDEIQIILEPLSNELVLEEIIASNIVEPKDILAVKGICKRF
jgi:hypothetical protein